MSEQNNIGNNKRIAKNTIVLYLRMFLLMFVGLYTSRINLQSLGIDNFGVYNVVAGFVVMFSSVTGSFSNAISRFVQVELGKKNISRLKTIYSTSINIQLLLGGLVAIVGEIVGMWFLYNKLQIPAECLEAAKWVLHFSIISFVIGLLCVPNNACIIAHEKMSAFAYISLLEAFMKLAVAYVVFITPFDKLVTFGFLIMFNQFVIRFIYIYYCKKHFEECKYFIVWDSGLLKEMSKFIGWNFLTQFAFVLNVQGINMLLNIFFGVTVNAARGIANQVNNAVVQFINNFMMAAMPQITKTYAAGDRQKSFSLVCMSSKFGYFLMFLLSLPILIETDTILKIWLKNPPDYSVDFVRWSLAASLTTLFGNPLFHIMMADGRIKTFQLVLSIVNFIPFPLTWLFFHLGFPVISAYVIYFVVYFLLIFVRYLLVYKVLMLPVKDYIIDVVGRVSVVSFLASMFPLILTLFMEQTILRLVIVIISSIISTLIAIYVVGLLKEEKELIVNIIKKRLKFS